MRLVHYSYPMFPTLTSARSIFNRSPWSGLENEIDRLFEGVITDLGGASSHRFPVDLYDDKDHTFVRAELPGVNRDDISVEMVDGYLTISGTRKTPGSNGESEEVHSFSRSISITDDIDANNVSASYENGILTVKLPKREEAKPRKITVSVK